MIKTVTWPSPTNSVSDSFIIFGTRIQYITAPVDGHYSHVLRKERTATTVFEDGFAILNG